MAECCIVCFWWQGTSFFCEGNIFQAMGKIDENSNLVKHVVDKVGTVAEMVIFVNHIARVGAMVKGKVVMQCGGYLQPLLLFPISPAFSH